MKQQREAERMPKKAKETRVITTRPLKDVIKTNVLAEAVTKWAGSAGTKIKIEKAGRGFVLKSEEGDAYVEDSFEEKENLHMIGSRISIESLRIPWFREALRNILGFGTDEELYEGLATERFFVTPWNPDYFLSIGPEKIFTDETLEGLSRARKESNVGLRNFNEYFAAMFAKMPEGFVIPGPFAAHMLADNAKALKSIVEQDSDYQEAVQTADAIIQEIIGMDPKALAEKIYSYFRKKDK